MVQADGSEGELSVLKNDNRQEQCSLSQFCMGSRRLHYEKTPIIYSNLHPACEPRG